MTDVADANAGQGFRPVQVDMVLIAIVVAMLGALVVSAPKNLAVAIGSRNQTLPASVFRPVPPPTPVPAVEPVKFVDMTPDQARDYNATIPFLDEHVRPAAPLVFAGSAADRENALTCLAAAVWYEAGDDKIGGQAVAQVVLNRARHPAFPKTVCGVVFEGSERKTGCQFTFACDGSLTRIPPAEQWKRARDIADKALSGFVFKPVGTATHYHTNWVVPYWASSLDKLTEVHTHIFYRWTGWWGLPQAFAGKLTQPEAIDPRIVALSRQSVAAGSGGSNGSLAATGMPTANEQGATKIEGVADSDLKGNIVRLADPDHGLFVLQLDPHAFAGSYALAALAICRTKATCRVLGWLPSPTLPGTLPIDEAKMRSASFRYQKTAGVETALWDCRVIARSIESQCLPGTGADTSESGKGASKAAL